jgi:hypothetical protein
MEYNSMPFSKRPDSIFDEFKLTIKSTRQPVSIQPQGIDATQFVTYTTANITTDGDHQSPKLIITKLRLFQNGLELATLNRDELRNFFQFVEQNTDANYRNVKTNPLWREVYYVQNKQFEKYDPKTDLASRVTEEATYCQHCGIVLPLRILTIDHQKPQQGGDVEAMLRVFRAAGLTGETGIGQKNRLLQQRIAPFSRRQPERTTTAQTKAERPQSLHPQR